MNLRVFGLVQGIGFRHTCCQQAKKLDLTGQVSNQSDGSVEILAEGEETDLKTFLAWCYNGVESARVDSIEELWSAATGAYINFVIRF